MGGGRCSLTLLQPLSVSLSLTTSFCLSLSPPPLSLSYNLFLSLSLLLSLSYNLFLSLPLSLLVQPFGHNLSQASILEQNTILKARDIEFPSKPQVSGEAKSFIRCCLAYQKEQRPDVLAICSHTYILPKKLVPASNNGSFIA